MPEELKKIMPEENAPLLERVEKLESMVNLLLEEITDGRCR